MDPNAPNITSTFRGSTGTTAADSGMRVQPPPSTTALHQLQAILASVRNRPFMGGPMPVGGGGGAVQAAPAQDASAHLGFGELPDANQARWDITNNPDQQTIRPTQGYQPGSVFTGWRP